MTGRTVIRKAAAILMAYLHGDDYKSTELAAVTGMTVRTTRYYAGLGLLPPPSRRGRIAYYTEQHRARLQGAAKVVSKFDLTTEVLVKAIRDALPEPAAA